ncbi:MAG: hypothetical protein PHC97_03150 [Patescibacteria group bacterium]|nr:hypothetical protein [Patescibacteria group bacterium]
MPDFKDSKTEPALVRRYPVKNSRDGRKKEIETELKKIYKTEGKLPALNKLEHKKKNGLKSLLILILVLFFLFAASALGFFVFQPKSNFTENKINLEIKGPFNISSGERITYEIKISNGEGVSLKNVQLIAHMPTGFIFENSTLMSKMVQGGEQSPSVKTWKLNDIFSNESTSVSVTGKLIGPVGSSEQFLANLNYQPVNFSSEFQKETSLTTQIDDSTFFIEPTYPAEVANSDQSEFTLNVKNKSEATELDSMRVELNYPAEFALNESQITIGENKLPLIKEKIVKGTAQKIWTIEKLLPQAEAKIKFSGKFNVDASKNLEFDLKTELKGSGEAYISQDEQKFDIDVVKGDLLTTLIINGSSQDKPANFGDSLNMLLTVKNKSSKLLGDLKIRAVIDSPLIDWTSLQDQNNGVRQDNQILWTKDQIPQLSLLIPEAEIEIPIQINIKNTKPENISVKDLLVKSYFEAQINKTETKDSQVKISSNTITNAINTDLDLSSQIRYFAADNTTIGSGPLPPIVGQKTTYTVFLKLTNSLHEITDIEVDVKLPGYVTFEGNEKISTGTLAKNDQNQVVWKISRIPTSIKETTAEFQISINPILSDINKILTLISEISLKATDSQTQSIITKSLSGFTTNLDADNLGKNKGLILAQ